MPKGKPGILSKSLSDLAKAEYKVVRAKSATDNTSLYTKHFGDDLKAAKDFIKRNKNPNFVLVRCL